MKKTILALTGAACFTLLPAGALAQQDSAARTDTARTEDAKSTAPEPKTTATAVQSSDNDDRGKSKKNKKKNSAKKAPAKEPTENEKIFDEMLRSAASGGL
ncbi:MAG TPA: hypothetical protein VNV88_12315 [Candidatus Solibacter sp.]|jgi:hypothetical protein|nr:hypothetical protein [Candidatus Solibacter sp.]